MIDVVCCSVDDGGTKPMANEMDNDGRNASVETGTTVVSGGVSAVGEL